MEAVDMEADTAALAAVARRHGASLRRLRLHLLTTGKSSVVVGPGDGDSDGGDDGSDGDSDGDSDDGRGYSDDDSDDDGDPRGVVRLSSKARTQFLSGRCNSYSVGEESGSLS